LAKCTGIKANGERCRGVPIHGSEWCPAHHPEYASARRHNGRKGGKSGGRGRPSAHLARLQERFEELADKVLEGEIDRAAGAVAGQLLNGARACVRDGLAAREQEELIARMEQLEEALERKEKHYGA
jgi:hypothetical protein